MVTYDVMVSFMTDTFKFCIPHFIDTFTGIHFSNYYLFLQTQITTFISLSHFNISRRQHMTNNLFFLFSIQNLFKFCGIISKIRIYMYIYNTDGTIAWTQICLKHRIIMVLDLNLEHSKFMLLPLQSFPTWLWTSSTNWIGKAYTIVILGAACTCT